MIMLKKTHERWMEAAKIERGQVVESLREDFENLLRHQIELALVNMGRTKRLQYLSAICVQEKHVTSVAAVMLAAKGAEQSARKENIIKNRRTRRTEQGAEA